MVAVDLNAGASVLLGKGDGTFHDQTNLMRGGNPLQVAVADFNADGHQDILVASELGGGCMLCGGPLTLYLGNGDGSFGDQFRVGNGPYAPGLPVVDLNADARLDLVMSDGPADELPIFVRNSNTSTVSTAKSATFTMVRGWISAARRGLDARIDKGPPANPEMDLAGVQRASVGTMAGAVGRIRK